MSENSTQEAIAEVWRLFKETDERMRETDAQIKATDVQIEKTSVEVAAATASILRLEALFTSQWGKMLEALVEPAALKLFVARGINVHRVYRRSRSQLIGESMEVDLLLEDERDVVVVEVKSTLKVADVQEFLADLDDFLRFFPRYRGMAVYGAVAALSMDENADRFAYRQGLFVLSVSGDNMVRILNDEAFRPRDFGAANQPQP